MKLASLIPILILSSILIINHPMDEKENDEWSKIYGIIGVAHDILKIRDGYLITGYCQPKGKENLDAFLLKIDSQGNEIWNKSFGGGDHDWGYGVICEDDPYIVAGAISKIIPRDDGMKIAPHVWVAKCSDSPL